MENPHNSFETLEAAFDQIVQERRPDLEKDLPAYVSPEEMLRKIRSRADQGEGSNIAVFSSDQENTLCMAARSGSEISETVLEKMKQNRESTEQDG